MKGSFIFFFRKNNFGAAKLHFSQVLHIHLKNDLVYVTWIWEILKWCVHCSISNSFIANTCIVSKDLLGNVCALRFHSYWFLLSLIWVLFLRFNTTIDNPSSDDTDLINAFEASSVDKTLFNTSEPLTASMCSCVLVDRDLVSIRISQAIHDSKKTTWIPLWWIENDRTDTMLTVHHVCLLQMWTNVWMNQANVTAMQRVLTLMGRSHVPASQDLLEMVIFSCYVFSWMTT